MKMPRTRGIFLWSALLSRTIYIMILFFLFLAGLSVGSFLNAVICRMESGESALKGRSHCMSCAHELAWHDLIPLVSFFVLRGRCRYCNARISFQYPLVEFAAGLLFAFLFVAHASFPAFLYSAAIFSLLLVIFVYDLKHFLIPDSAVFSAIAIAFLWRIFEFLKFDIWNLFGIWNLEFGISLPFVQALFSAIAASLFFFAIYAVSRGGAMGFGDVKLAFFMGLFLGWPNILVGLFLAFSMGAFVGISLVFLRKKQFSSEVPFAPFLILGTFIAFLWGNSVAQWYLKFLY
ncbi:MAG: prepilin peptidase [Candidatus Wildermuthbacteria bacterium]|nr:prepilin peptidase [Candidatus Wildermuthbacteria bacterium]